MDTDKFKQFFSHSNNSFLLNWIFTCALAVIIGLSCFSIYELQSLANARNWVVHTYQVMLANQKMLDGLTYLDSKQYEPDFGSDRDTVITQIKTSSKELIKLTQDNPEQNNRTHRFVDLADKKIILFSKIAQLQAGQNTLNPALNNVLKESQALSSEGRLLSHEINDVEKVLLSLRDNTVVSNRLFMNSIYIVGQIISIAFLLMTILLFNHELRQRKTADRQKRFAEIQLRGVINGASDMIAALDPQYRFIIFNEAYKQEFKKLFNVDIEIGKTIDELLGHVPHELKKVKQNWDASLEGNEYVKTVDFVLNNQALTYEITSSLMKDADGRILGAAHIIRNISERIKKEMQLQESLLQLEDKNEKISLLLDMSDIMLASDSLVELSSIISKYCTKILGFASGVFYLMHPSKNFLEENGIFGEPKFKSATFTKEQCWALRLGHIHQAELTSDDLICDHIHINAGDMDKHTSYLCIPLRAQTEIYGLLYLEVIHNLNEPALSPNERLLINAFSELAALALANVRLRENLSYQSLRDPLTSLYNRRYLEEFLLKQIYQSERTHNPLAVLMLDLDHFKRINDVHGHEAGDIVLKEFSHILMSEIRSGDIASRYGGEEFIIILYNTTAEDAVHRAENIRQAVSLLHVKYGAQDIGEVTVSIGVAEYPRNGQSAGELIEAADKALYVAKNRGRDRVVVYNASYTEMKSVSKY